MVNLQRVPAETQCTPSLPVQVIDVAPQHAVQDGKRVVMDKFTLQPARAPRPALQPRTDDSEGNDPRHGTE
jgi:hypothetical protein